MKRKTLHKSVIVYGKDIYGRDAWVEFEPMKDGQPGFYWKIPLATDPSKFEYIPIDWRIAFASEKMHHIYLKYNCNILRIYEHIDALRNDGYDSIAISGTEWPPYEVTEFYRQKLLKQTVHSVVVEIPYFTFSKPYKSSFVDDDGLPRSFEIIPNNKSSMSVDAFVSFKKYAINGHIQSIITSDILDEVFPIGPPAIFPVYYWISKLCGFHYHKVVVRPSKNKEETGKKYAGHAVVDILGDINLLSHYMLPSCDIISSCSGHKQRLELIKEIGRNETLVKITKPQLVG